jgi:hypothetical protein
VRAVEGIYYCTNSEKGVKSNCNNYGGISLLSTAYTGDHHCGFSHNVSTMDQIFYIWQILEKKWECNGMVHQLFIDFKKAERSSSQ